MDCRSYNSRLFNDVYFIRRFAKCFDQQQNMDWEKITHAYLCLINIRTVNFTKYGNCLKITIVHSVLLGLQSFLSINFICHILNQSSRRFKTLSTNLIQKFSFILMPLLQKFPIITIHALFSLSCRAVVTGRASNIHVPRRFHRQPSHSVFSSRDNDFTNS